jgi:hypothetical protein
LFTWFSTTPTTRMHPIDVGPSASVSVRPRRRASPIVRKKSGVTAFMFGLPLRRSGSESRPGTLRSRLTDERKGAVTATAAASTPGRAATRAIMSL